MAEKDQLRRKFNAEKDNPRVVAQLREYPNANSISAAQRAGHITQETASAMLSKLLPLSLSQRIADAVLAATLVFN